MDLKLCRICDAPGTYEDGGQSIEEHLAVGSTDPWCECECCGNTERYHDWQDSEPLDSPLRRQLAAANERVGRLEELRKDAWAMLLAIASGNGPFEKKMTRADMMEAARQAAEALEVPDAL